MDFSAAHTPVLLRDAPEHTGGGGSGGEATAVHVAHGEKRGVISCVSCVFHPCACDWSASVKQPWPSAPLLHAACWVHEWTLLIPINSMFTRLISFVHGVSGPREINANLLRSQRAFVGPCYVKVLRSCLAKNCRQKRAWVFYITPLKLISYRRLAPASLHCQLTSRQRKVPVVTDSGSIYFTNAGSCETKLVGIRGTICLNSLSEVSRDSLCESPL